MNTLSDSPASPPPRHPWMALAVVLAIVAVVVAILTLRGDRDPLADVVSVTVARGDVEDTVTALGNLQPKGYVDVGAQVSGQLERLHVAVGDSVEEGDLLAEIDPAVLVARVEAVRAQLEAQRAQLLERRAQLALAEDQYRRQQQLRADDATSEDAYQVARAATLTTRAQIQALEAQIRQTESTLRGDEATLGFTRIFAPMSGTVVSLEAKQGQTLNANQMAPVILRIADLSTMTVWTQVSEADVARLQPGMEAYFTTLGSPRRWQGSLRQILPTPEVVNNVVLYTALFDVDNPRGSLMTQMTAQVFFIASAARDVIIVPMAALQPLDRRAGRYRATVIENGRLTERDIEIGVSNRVTAEVRSGLREGEQVLLARGGSVPAGTPPRDQALRMRGLR